MSLERLANVAIIVLCMTVSAVLVKKHFIEPAPPPSGIKSGESLQLPTEAGLSQADRTLVVALSPRCRFCSESLPFYSEIVGHREQTNAEFRIAAIVEPDDLLEEKRILQSSRIHVDALVSVDLRALGILGTPTLVLVDRNGKAIQVWKGKLSEESQLQVLQSLGLVKTAAR